jgi:type VI protein secretion system component Hcp
MTEKASRSRRARARRNLAGPEPLEERQLLSALYYMLVGDGTVVQGEASDANAPRGSFEISTFAWGVMNGAKIVSPPGKASAPNFSITKPLDTASTGLFAACTAGARFTTAEILVFSKPGSDSNEVEILEYDFSNLVVASAQLSNAPNSFPTEVDTFAFTAVQLHFWTISPETGGQGKEFSASWDFQKSRVNALLNLTLGLGDSKGLAKTEHGHATRVKGSHKAVAAGVNQSLAIHKVPGAQSAAADRISAVAKP